MYRIVNEHFLKFSIVLIYKKCFLLSVLLYVGLFKIGTKMFIVVIILNIIFLNLCDN